MNQLRLLSKPANRQMEFQMQLLQVHARDIAHLDMLQVIPASRIPRAQVRCISRQSFQVNPLGSPTRQELGDRTPTMNPRTIPDDQQPSAALTAQRLQE